MRPSVRSLGTKALMLAALAAPARSQDAAPAALETGNRVAAVLTESERDQVLARVQALRRQVAESTDALVKARAQAALEALEAAAGLPVTRARLPEAAPASERAPEEAFPSKKTLAWALAVAVLVAAALALAKRGDKKAAARKLAQAEKKIKEMAAENAEAEKLAEGLSADLAAADRENERIRKERAGAVAQLEAEREAKKRAESEREDLRAIAMREKGENDAALAALAETRAKAQEAEERAVLAQTQADELERQAAELRQALENSDAAALIKRIDEMAQTNELLAGRLNVAQGEVSLQAKDNAALQEKVRIDRAEIAGLERQVKDVQALAEADRAARLEEIGQLMASRDAALQQVRATEEAAQAELESAQERAEEERERAQAALSAAQADLAASREAHRAAQAELESAAGKLGASEIARSDDHRRHGEVLAREVARLEGEIALAEGRVQAAHEAAETLRERALAREAHLEAELARAQTRHQEETALRQSEFSAKLADLETRAARDLAGALARAQELSDRLGAAEAALARKSEESDLHAANHAAAAKEVAGLNGVLRAHLADLEQAADTIERLRERLKAANFDLIARDANRRVEENVQLLEAARAKQEAGVAKSHEILAQGEAEAATLRQKAEHTRQALDAAVARQAEIVAGSLKDGLMDEARAALDKRITPDFVRNTARDAAVDAISGDPKVRAAAEQTIQSLTASRSLEIKRQVTGELDAIKDEKVAEGKAAISAVAAGLAQHKQAIEGLVAFAKAKIREDVAKLRGKFKLMVEKVSDDHGKLTAILTKDKYVEELGERADQAEDQAELNDIIKELGVVVMEDDDYAELMRKDRNEAGPDESEAQAQAAAKTEADAAPSDEAGQATGSYKPVAAEPGKQVATERRARAGGAKAEAAQEPAAPTPGEAQGPALGMGEKNREGARSDAAVSQAELAAVTAAAARPASEVAETIGRIKAIADAIPSPAAVPTAAQPAVQAHPTPLPAGAQRSQDIKITKDDGMDDGSGDTLGHSGRFPTVTAAPEDMYLEFLKGTGTNLADIAINRLLPSLPVGFAAAISLGSKSLQIHRSEGAGGSPLFSLYLSPMPTGEPEDKVTVAYLTGKSVPQAGNGWTHVDAPNAFKTLVVAVDKWSQRATKPGLMAPGRHPKLGSILDELAAAGARAQAESLGAPLDKVRLANLNGARENLAVLWLRHHGKNGTQIVNDLETFVIPSFPYNKPVDVKIGLARTQIRPARDGYVLVDAVSMEEAARQIGRVPAQNFLQVDAGVSDLVVDASGTPVLDKHHVVGALIMRIGDWSQTILAAGAAKKQMSAVYLAATVGVNIAKRLRAMDHKGHEKLPEVIARFEKILQEFQSRKK